jgi:glycosyltransferase involved in cell wall biosynthesis
MTTPFLSVVIACRNEERFIGTCLDSLIANDYPSDRLEILVVDGQSTDRTREVVSSYSERYAFVRLLDNRKRITPVALNIGIKAAKGEVIARVDGHARVAANYLSRCVAALHEYGADNVGGIMITLPRDDTLMARGIALALSSKFGVGNSYFRVHTNEVRAVDTVFGGCYRRDVFDRIGLFNEHLRRSQDMEFNRRLVRHGGKILLVPDVVSYYYANSSFKAYMRQNWANGVWAIMPFKYAEGIPVTWRHLTPAAFALSLSGALGLTLLRRKLWPLLALVLAPYALVNLAASAQVAKRERDPRLLATMPITFAGIHFGYGFGSLWGLVQLAKGAVRPDRG